jgi:cysteine synthase A
MDRTEADSNLFCLDRTRDTPARDWAGQAIEKLHADQHRSADTHLIRLDLPKIAPVTIYLKDESTHPTGSLKHRLARSLFYYGLCNGRIGPQTAIVEASSGSTAISEAYFARLLGLRFIAIVPEGTSRSKLAQVEFYGGECRAVPPGQIYDAADRLARELNGHYMDQFTYAEQATDWRGNNNIAESLFQQMALEPQPIPEWIVVGAGTGGTAATIGRYIRYTPRLNGKTRLCVADPENSVFFEYFRTRDATLTSAQRSRIEGIGRPRVEKSFLPDVIDAMMRVPDAASCAAALWLKTKIGRLCGASTGTNVYAALKIAAHIAREGRPVSIVTLICDGGERYADSCYCENWRRAEGLDLSIHAREMELWGG